MPKTKKVKSIKRKKKTEIKVDKGIINVHSSFNNVVISLTDRAGNALAWTSAGSLGFKGTKKSTPFAASKAAKEITQKAKNFGVLELDIRVKGVGAGRESAIRTFVGSGLLINSIKDVTPIPHGGVRPKKVRRV